MATTNVYDAQRRLVASVSTDGAGGAGIRVREAKKTARREIAYFNDHEEHMHYEKNAALGVPVGSGAMESQCSKKVLVKPSPQLEFAFADGSG